MNETLFHGMTIFSVFDYVNDFFNYVYFKKSLIRDICAD
jgi:hypothetical protein